MIEIYAIENNSLKIINGSNNYIFEINVLTEIVFPNKDKITSRFHKNKIVFILECKSSAKLLYKKIDGEVKQVVELDYPSQINKLQKIGNKIVCS
jgi:hypothetical protein